MKCFCVFVGLLWGGFVFGADIRVVGAGSDQAVPVSLQAFRVETDAASALFLQTLRTNLDRWGWFRVTEGASAAYTLQGRAGLSGRSFVVTVEAVDTRTGRAVYSERFREDPADARAVALRLQDGLTEAIHRVPGIASTRIAFAGSVNGSKDLYLIAADGEDLVQLTRDGVPVFRPAWSPDAKSLFYTSYVRGFPDIYRVDLVSNRRSVVSREAGINAGASVSPDGSRLALVLSRDGNPEVYVRNQGDGQLTRITRTPHHAEASPAWSPDGSQIAFVSDMEGGPHVFVVPAAGGRPQRVSRRGNENVSPDWGPDGRLVYSSRRLGRYQIVVYDPRTGEETQLTQDPVHHENPSWARDGRHLVFARRDGRISSLYLLDTRTGSQVRLMNRPGDWYFPAWSRN